MQRYFLNADLGYIEGDDAHHIVDVMRMKTNDQIIICAEGICYQASIRIDKSKVYYEKKEILPAKKIPHITLFQGLPKHPKIETTLKYATVYGVSEIVVTEMKRSVNKLDYVINKKKRFETIMKEASELAHRSDVPVLTFMKQIKSDTFLEFDLVLLADEEEKETTISKVLHAGIPNKTAIIIGPEGGIDSSERTMWIQLGAKPITLGTLIFPSEIAHLYVLSQILEKNIN